MKTISTLKNDARLALRGNWGTAAIAAVLFAVIMGATNGAPALGFFFLAVPIEFGYVTAFRKMLHGNSDVIDNTASAAFENYTHKVGTGALRWLYVFLFTLLLIIPGIIKSLSYALVPYILEDNPALTSTETLRLSADMMRGHKGRLFGLYLSFIGWWFLCLFTLGIGFFFLQPFVKTTVAAFYEDVKENYNPDPYLV